MGLKSGSRDAGLDKTEDSEEQSTNPEATESDKPDIDIESSPNPKAESTGQRPSMNSIPYKLRREKVNEGRDQVPFFLREEVINAEDEFQDTLEEILDENVYKSDYREAAMVVAQRNPELVVEVLREWGYDLDSR